MKPLVLVYLRAQTRDKKYKAGKDFNYIVEILYSDKSYFKFRYAKLVYDNDYLVIHTEHHGIHVFSQYDVKEHDYYSMWG